MCPPGQSSYTRQSRLRRAHSPAAPTGVSSARRVCPPPPPPRLTARTRPHVPCVPRWAVGREGLWGGPAHPSVTDVAPAGRNRRRRRPQLWPSRYRGGGGAASLARGRAGLLPVRSPPPPLNGREGKARRSSGVAGKPEALSCTATSASLWRAGNKGTLWMHPATRNGEWRAESDSQPTSVGLACVVTPAAGAFCKQCQAALRHPTALV